MKIVEVDLLKESTYQTPCGTIHYWSNILSLDTMTLIFLPGLTADHRLFDKQVEYFEGKYNMIIWDAPVMAIVTLVDSSGKEVTVKADDARLYERNINEGDKVCLDVNNKLEKVE